MKFFGYEFYYDLANHVGSPLSEKIHPKQYAKVMAIQTALNADLDETLAAHNIKLDKIVDSF